MHGELKKKKKQENTMLWSQEGKMLFFLLFLNYFLNIDPLCQITWQKYCELWFFQLYWGCSKSWCAFVCPEMCVYMHLTGSHGINYWNHLKRDYITFATVATSDCNCRTIITRSICLDLTISSFVKRFEDLIMFSCDTRNFSGTQVAIKPINVLNVV